MSAVAVNVSAMSKTHALRSKPPWREGRDFTVCDRDASGLAAVPADEFTALLERENDLPWHHGNACDRCAYRWPSIVVTWPGDPVAVIASELMTAPAKVLEPELRALGELAARHPDEFRELVEGESVMRALARL